jgi:transposase
MAPAAGMLDPAFGTAGLTVMDALAAVGVTPIDVALPPGGGALVLRPDLIFGLPGRAFWGNLVGNQEVPMNRKYIVRLSDDERAVCDKTIKDEKGKSEKLRRATILLKADADGPGWNDRKISEAVGCSTRTVENVRQAFVLEGFEAALVRKKRASPPTPKLLDGAGEAQLIALRLGKPPAGYGQWTLRLLADQLVELEVVDSISPETVRQTLKKTE